MGSSTSKAAGAAARKYPTRPPPSTTTTSSGRPINPQPRAAGSPSAPGPSVHPAPQATTSRTEAINLDAADPDFARSLRSLGAVQPNPTLSPSSRFGDVLASRAGARGNTPSASTPGVGGTSDSYANVDPSGVRGGPPVGPDPRMNPALIVLRARERIAAEAEAEVGEMGRRGFRGRKYTDVGTIRNALGMRARGVEDAKIEDMLELRRGTMAVLGRKGVVGTVELGEAV